MDETFRAAVTDAVATMERDGVAGPGWVAAFRARSLKSKAAGTAKAVPAKPPGKAASAKTAANTKKAARKPKKANSAQRKKIAVSAAARSVAPAAAKIAGRTGSDIEAPEIRAGCAIAPG